MRSHGVVYRLAREVAAEAHAVGRHVNPAALIVPADTAANAIRIELVECRDRAVKQRPQALDRPDSGRRRQRRRSVRRINGFHKLGRLTAREPHLDHRNRLAQILGEATETRLRGLAGREVHVIAHTEQIAAAQALDCRIDLERGQRAHPQVVAVAGLEVHALQRVEQRRVGVALVTAHRARVDPELFGRKVLHALELLGLRVLVPTLIACALLAKQYLRRPDVADALREILRGRRRGARYLEVRLVAELRQLDTERVHALGAHFRQADGKRCDRRLLGAQPFGGHGLPDRSRTRPVRRDVGQRAPRNTLSERQRFFGVLPDLDVDRDAAGNDRGHFDPFGASTHQLIEHRPDARCQLAIPPRRIVREKPAPLAFDPRDAAGPVLALLAPKRLPRFFQFVREQVCGKNRGRTQCAVLAPARLQRQAGYASSVSISARLSTSCSAVPESRLSALASSAAVSASC